MTSTHFGFYELTKWKRAFNMAAQRDSAIQARIGQEAIKETIAMEAIAVMTTTFLPASFVAIGLSNKLLPNGQHSLLIVNLQHVLFSL